MSLISIFGQGFCEIVISNLSTRSRPRIGLNPSATTLILLFEFSNHYNVLAFLEFLEF